MSLVFYEIRASFSVQWGLRTVHRVLADTA